jgi:hypothetical protein
MRFFQSVAVVVLSLLALSTARPAQKAPAPSDETICDTDGPRPDRDETLHEQIATTANGPIGYYRFGQGHPLILITGYRANLSEWNASFLAELAKTNQVILFDNRGIGRSPPDLANYDAQTLARDTSSLINALGLRLGDSSRMVYGRHDRTASGRLIISFY